MARDDDRSAAARARRSRSAPWRTASRPCRRRGSGGSSTSSRRWTTSSASGWGSPTSTRPSGSSRPASARSTTGRTHYTSNYGTIELRRALADHLERRYGVAYDPATELLITVGASEAVDLALRATCDPGDEVILHEPSYVAYVAGDHVRRRRGRPRRDAARGRLRARPGRGRGGDHAADEGAVPRLPVQPDRRRPARRRPGRARRDRRPPRPARLQRRDLRPARVRHVPPPRVQRAARDARPDDPHGRLLARPTR